MRFFFFFFLHVAVLRLSFLVSFCCSYCWKCFFPTCWCSHFYIAYIRMSFGRVFFSSNCRLLLPCRFSQCFLFRAKAECRSLNAGDFCTLSLFTTSHFFSATFFFFFFDVGIFGALRRTKVTSEFAKKTPYQLDICPSIFCV
uniref:Putative secreted protein n=1 Tax=Ixodes ricinus TaxID=34613 RepID=A0A6B0UUB6_IXORI